MAQNRSESSRYPSVYSPQKWVTSAQYIIELVCENKAKHKKVDLPIHCGKQANWATFDRTQTRAGHKLLKDFDEKAIIKTIKEKNVRNLLPKWIRPVIVKEQQIIDAKQKLKDFQNKDKSICSPKSGTIVSQRRTAKFKSSMDKLLDFDLENENGEKEVC